jgi:hypothetical protein
MSSPDTPGRGSLPSARIVTPGDWIELDLDPATRHTSIRKAVRRAVARDKALERNAVRLIAILDKISRRAHDSGAFYCASLVLNEATCGVFVANVLMQLCGKPLASAPPRASAMEVCAGFAAAISADPGWAGAEVTVVPLVFVGPAVRVCLVDDAIVLQYIVPLAVPSVQAVLTFICPCPPYAATALELFDAMASSLTLRYECGLTPGPEDS